MIGYRQRSINRFSQEFRLFLFINTCFTAFINMNAVFLNTYILRITNDSSMVMKYNIVLALVQPISMVLSANMIRKKGAIRTQRFGLWLAFAAYVILIIVGEQVIGVFYWIAAILSAASGFYYTTYALQVIEYTSDTQRDEAYGLMGVMGNIVTLLIPLASGVLISAFVDFTGYRLMFVAGLLICLGAIILSSRLPEMRQSMRNRDRLGKVAVRMLTGRRELQILIMSTLTGIRAGTMSFFLTLLLYSLVQSELLIGVNTFLGGIAAIISSMVYGRLVTPSLRGRSMVISLTILLLSTTFMFVMINPTVIVGYNIINSLLSAFIDTMPVVVYMAVLEKSPQIKGYGAEVHTIREFFYSFGRIAGICFAMAVPSGVNGAIVVLLGLTLSQFIVAGIMVDIQKKLSDLP